jgi:hypothetical protein
MKLVDPHFHGAKVYPIYEDRRISSSSLISSCVSLAFIPPSPYRWIDLVAAVDLAINRLPYANAETFHQNVKQMYNWNDVAERTEQVYWKMREMHDYPLIERLRRYYGCGTWAGKIFCCVIALDFLFHLLLEYLLPKNEVDIAPDLKLIHPHHRTLSEDSSAYHHSRTPSNTSQQQQQQQQTMMSASAPPAPTTAATANTAIHLNPTTHPIATPTTTITPATVVKS